MYYYDDGVGNFGTEAAPEKERKYTIIQSLWTKPIKDKEKLKHILLIAALSLAYAHRSGYRVHMHTDAKGVRLFRRYGYEGLFDTLEKIPHDVPTELFAAGKFFAMTEEGGVDKVHIDLDVFLKKPVLDVFYENPKIDLICQQDEPEEWSRHVDKRSNMFILGYPALTRPSWKGSLNTGVVGFHDPDLCGRYITNYMEALSMYTKDVFDRYRKTHIVSDSGLLFDFILEQITLSYLSLGYNVHTLIPSDLSAINYVADNIGYQHLQGGGKWDKKKLYNYKAILAEMDRKLYLMANEAIARVQ